MSSPLIQRILSRIIAALVESEKLVLVEGANPDRLTAELTAAMADAPGFSQFGAWLSGTLLDSPLVDDLYATDAELAAMLREVEP